MPLVSVIIAAFRAEATLARAVRSLLAQRLDDWEALIVADDGADYRPLLAAAGLGDERLRFLASGRIAWQVPFGVLPALEAKGITNTGAPSLGGTIATAGGLVFIGGTPDARFRAFDTRTGAVLWTATLDASAHATPITYRGPRSGKQFVVVTAGGGGYLSETTSDAVVAFALP